MAVGSIFYAVNYFASREATQEQVVSRVFFIMWATVFPCVFGIVATYVQWCASRTPRVACIALSVCC